MDEEVCSSGRRWQGLDEKQVGSIVSALGPSSVWNKYASICIKEGLDGPTMFHAKIDDLVDIGVCTRLHCLGDVLSSCIGVKI